MKLNEDLILQCQAVESSCRDKQKLPGRVRVYAAAVWVILWRLWCCLWPTDTLHTPPPFPSPPPHLLPTCLPARLAVCVHAAAVWFLHWRCCIVKDPSSQVSETFPLQVQIPQTPLSTCCNCCQRGMHSLSLCHQYVYFGPC